MGKNTETVSWNREDDVFEDFSKGLELFTKTGELPESGDQDVHYYMELQKNRLKKRHMKISYDITPRKDFADINKQSKSWSDELYTNKLEWHPCRLEKAFFREGEKLYKKSQNKIFYQYITYAKNEADVSDELYSCPSCGAVSPIKELYDGCSYCGTRFSMDDLFPKVTNYFFVPDGDNKEESRVKMKKSIAICTAIMSVVCILVCLVYGNSPATAIGIGLVEGVITGPIMGWFVMVASLIFGISSQAKDTTGMLFNSIGSKGSFVNKMKRYSSEFSYEYFTGKVLSLLKMLIYSEDVSELAPYKGNATGELFADVVDSSYAGAVALKRFDVVGDYAEIDVDAYVENMYDCGGHIKRKIDKCRLHLRKNINKPIDYHFSIKKLQCKGCGASFDATKHKTCTSCGAVYDIGDEDWVVTNIEKR